MWQILQQLHTLPSTTLQEALAVCILMPYACALPCMCHGVAVRSLVAIGHTWMGHGGCRSYSLPWAARLLAPSGSLDCSCKHATPSRARGRDQGFTALEHLRYPSSAALFTGI